MRYLERFSLTDTVVALLDATDGAFREVNPAFTRLLGYPPGQVIGRRPIDLGFWPDPELRAELWASLRADRRIAGKPVRVRAADGRILAGTLHCEMIADGAAAAELFCLLHGLHDERDESVMPSGSDSYRSLFLAATEGIYRSLPGGGFLDLNPAMARMFGYESVAQMLVEHGTSAVGLYADPQTAEHVRSMLARDGCLEQFRCRLRRRDGSLIWASENMHVVRDASGRELFHEGTLVDITAEVEAEAALKQSEALYRVLVDTCHDGVFLVQDGKLLFANRALQRIVGHDLAPGTSVDYLDWVSPEDRAVQAQRLAARAGGSLESQNFEISIQRQDGRRVLCEVHAEGVIYQGRPASTGIIRDITEERMREQTLVRAERRYRELFEHSPVGLFRTRPDGTIVEINPPLAWMLGYESPEALKASVASMSEVYANPEQRQRLVDLVIAEGGFRNQIVDVHARDGSRVTVRASVRMIRDEVTGEMHFAGSVEDVTTTLRTERALERSEAMYRTLVEHSQVGVFLSRDDRYVYVNRRLAEMIGYEESDLLGRHYRDFLAPEMIEASIERDRLIRANGQTPSEFESCNLHRDGQRVPVVVSVGPLEIDGVRHFSGTVRDITQQREMERQLRYSAEHDALTGLPNRISFSQRLNTVVEAAQRSGRFDYALFFLDLDGFKWVNDSLGHSAGNLLLAEIAERLRELLGDQVLLGRYGGDEFTLLVESDCDEAAACEIAQRVLALFAKPLRVGDQQFFSSASVGIVIGHPYYVSADQAMRDADTAMYRAKALGKAAYVVFDEAMHLQAQLRFRLETDLRLALERQEFRVYYQPIVALDDRRIVGCEALVRWQHPQRGLLAPAEFLQVAEDTGLISALDSWVLGEASRQVAQWRASYPDFAGLSLNVNVDERQMAGGEIIGEVGAALAASGLPPEALRLEVTETVFRMGRGQAEQRLAELKALGVSLVVDDFGTGYSSLDSFASSPFDALKVDRNFVRDMETNPRHLAIVRTITGFAEDLGLALTAEGVETEPQRELLIDIGCVHAQGYLFSPPIAADAFARLLDASVALA